MSLTLYLIGVTLLLLVWGAIWRRTAKDALRLCATYKQQGDEALALAERAQEGNAAALATAKEWRDERNRLAALVAEMDLVLGPKLECCNHFCAEHELANKWRGDGENLIEVPILHCPFENWRNDLGTEDIPREYREWQESRNAAVLAEGNGI